VVSDLAHLGLLYLLSSADGKGYYVPTYLTAGLSSGASGDETGGGRGGGGGGGGGYMSGGGGGGGDGGGHVLVETNYRVYAYTTSAVEIEILRLFTRPDYRLPNLYVGMLTRECVLQVGLALFTHVILQSKHQFLTASVRVWSM
jgi:transcription initiation factor TFIIH subunit 4